MRWNQPYPVEKHSGGGGYYGAVISTGLLAAALAAADPVFAFMFAPASDGRTWRAQLKYLRMQGITTTAYGTAQVVDFYAYKASAFTVADSGGAAAIPATLGQKKQNHYADSKFVGGGDIRVATTGKLTAGTRTLEAQPFAGLLYWSGAIGAGGSVEHKYDEHHVPQCFKSGEGFVIQNGTLLGATGVTKLMIELEWMEEVIGTHGW